MGFTAGLYKFVKYESILSMEELEYINYYYQYSQNSWAKEKFNSPEEYGKYMANNLRYINLNEVKEIKIPDKKAIEFYKDHLFKDSYNENNYSIFANLGDWYSNGSKEIYNWFQDLKKDSNMILLSQKDIINFAIFCWNYIENNLPKSCIITKAYKNIENEDGNEDSYIKLIDCDGIEATFEDGKMLRFETNGEYGDFSIPDIYYDEYTISGYILGLKYALNILATTDFTKETVFYEGGW